jgi:hypothetical protein
MAHCGVIVVVMDGSEVQIKLIDGRSFVREKDATLLNIIVLSGKQTNNKHSALCLWSLFVCENNITKI